MELAAYGWVALPWWTWPLIFVVVMAGVYAGMLLDRLHDRRTDRGPVPCLHLTSMDPDDLGYWCWKAEGHTGGHSWMADDPFDNRCGRDGCMRASDHIGLCLPDVH